MLNRINNDQVSSAIWFTFGIIICISSLKYRLSTLGTPGVGFLPFLVGITLCLCSLIGFTLGVLKQRRGIVWRSPLKGVNWKKSLTVLVALFGYALLLTPLGFSVCTAIFVGFLLRTISPQKWPVVILVAIFTASGSYMIFGILLKAQLPHGPWGF